MEQANKKEKYRISKWIFLSISILINAFIIFQSCLDNVASAKWSNFLSRIFETEINKGKGVTPPEVKVTSLSLSYLDSYKYNNVDGYVDHDDTHILPIGCTKLITASILPKDATDTSITWTSDNKNILYLTRQGKNLAITGNNIGTATITATSNSDNSIKDTFTFEVVDLIKPTNFDISIDNLSIPLNGGDRLPINIINDDLVTKTYDQEMFLQRYYDVDKLTYTSNDTSIIDIDENNILIGKSIGSTEVTVSNGTVNKTVTVNVTASETDQVLPEIDNITCYADDMDNARTDNTVGYKYTLDDVIIIPNNKNYVRVSSDNRIIGYRKLSSSDINSSITVIDKHNINNKKDYSVTLTNPPLTDISIKVTGATLENDIYQIEIGGTISVSISYIPSNVYGATFTITTSNSKISEVINQGNSFYVKCLDEGDITITITCNENNSITKSFNVHIIKRGIINDDNRTDFYKFVRKSWGHFLLFTVNGVFTTLAIYQFLYKKKWWLSLAISAAAGISIAALSEFIQSFVPGRAGRISDVAVDSIGYLLSVLAFAIVLFVLIVIRNKKNKDKPQQ